MTPEEAMVVVGVWTRTIHEAFITHAKVSNGLCHWAAAPAVVPAAWPSHCAFVYGRYDLPDGGELTDLAGSILDRVKTLLRSLDRLLGGRHCATNNDRSRGHDGSLPAHQLKGIEINSYAAELTRVTIWIGEIQWMIHNGFAYLRNPVLRPLDNIQTKDALIDWTDPERPREADWPDADVIIGNPPFLGAKLLRRGLGNDYVETLYRIFGDRLPGMSDFVAYWHEKARAMVEQGRVKRVGMLATQGIRGGRGRTVLERIKKSGDIFVAWSDEPWVLNGASVHISFIGYDDGTEKDRMLDGKPVASISASLRAGVDLTKARRLRENAGVAFIADVKGGPFDIPAETAYPLLDAHNPDGRSNRDVVRRWVNGLDIVRRPRGMWIIDFGWRMAREEAALYEALYEFVARNVKPFRDTVRRKSYRERWWLHVEPGSGMRRALSGLSRFIATPILTKHRVFVWLPADVLADHQLVVFARDDDYTFGVLHSGPHELWALALGTQLETRRATPPRPRSRPFPSRGRRTCSGMTSRRRRSASTSCARAG